MRLLAFAVGDADSPGIEISGDPEALPSIIAVVDRPDPGFNIIEP
jgi:alkyl sulfatase BDS1-like metallo-beta-lactamase superfamily hydrolase